MGNLSLRAKIYLCNGITVSFLIALGAICFISSKSLQVANFWVDHTHKVIQKSMSIEGAAVDMETGMRGFMLSGKEEFLAPYNGGEGRFYQLLSELKNTVSDNPSQVALLDEIRTNIKEWQTEVTNPAIDFRREVRDGNKTMDDVATLIGQAKGKTYFDKFRTQIATFREREASLMDNRKLEADKEAKFTMSVVIVGVAFSATLAIIMSLLLYLSISRPFQNIFRGLKTFSKRELDDLSKKFEKIIQNLSSGAANVATASQSIASGASEQASSIQETSSSLEEMSGMIQNNVTSSEKSAKLSDDVKKASQEGNESMKNLQVSMSEILESNEKIRDLVKVIGNIGDKTQVMDEIVFQTKLLSFNASVEAERAGEHGRGFAVVAQEVGNLAQMSGVAAQEIAEIVKESIKSAEVITVANKEKVEQGNTLAINTGKVLENILESAATVSEGSQQVLAASKDQSKGIIQINDAMTQLDKVTQENSASTEELSGQAEELHRAVSALLEIMRGDNSEVNEKQEPPRKGNVVNLEERRKEKMFTSDSDEPSSEWEAI
jgi:methyl-accepting chemotaxis protein